MRVYALSDLHVDYIRNMSLIQQISATEYVDDTLLLAGDISDDLDRLMTCLDHLRAKFRCIFFVPGNHDLWVRREEAVDSIAKFWRILSLCQSLNVMTTPARVGGSEGAPGVWIVPLYSWYVKPEEGDCSLYIPKTGDDPTLSMWSDNRFTRWPILENGTSRADYFLQLNEKNLRRIYDAPVISFSHFLPRKDLMFSAKGEKNAAKTGRGDRHPTFNFSRVAGCTCLEKQIRQLNSAVHVYGHQHRDRFRRLNDVLYVSHCLGYPRDRTVEPDGDIDVAPKLIWET
ncbi:MAG: metallophosphoesterase [Candidatus Poribacteria bacterium]|nr:metallophosphoesterase [Candidatus Poribacteria bacterium]